ncbi:MAG: hypothetical protein Q4C00_05050 [Bacillota bacterium]|nr:hypothetical protein [Bacillota bacterium]
MGKDTFTRNALEKRLDKAIREGDIKLADSICRELYSEEEPEPIAMPEELPAEIMLRKKKGEYNMKSKSRRRLIVSMAAFVIVLSFGVTAYANGWINNLVTVFQAENRVVVGEKEVDMEKYNEERANAKDTSKTYGDFSAACADYDMPVALPAALSEENGYSLAGEVTALAVEGGKSAINILVQYERGDEYIDINFSRSDDPQEFVIEFDDGVDITSERKFLSSRGDEFTVYSIEVNDYHYDQAIISVNNYIYQISFSHCSPEVIETILNSLDLAVLKQMS